MKLSVMQENLARGLGVVSRAVSNRSTLPVLANVLLKTEDGGLRLTTTNLEVGLVYWVPGKVETDGATTVPARLLSDLVSSLSGGDRIDLETGAGETLHLKSGRFEGETLTLAAADNYRIAVKTIPVLDPVGETSVVVPARALTELMRILGDTDEPVEVVLAQSRNQVLFHLEGIDLVSRLTRSMPSRWNRIWLRLWARTTSTGSSESARKRMSSISARAGTTTLVSPTGSRIGIVLTAIR